MGQFVVDHSQEAWFAWDKKQAQKRDRIEEKSGSGVR
jgi:hypothetical protein